MLSQSDETMQRVDLGNISLECIYNQSLAGFLSSQELYPISPHDSRGGGSSWNFEDRFFSGVSGIYDFI